MVIGFTFLISSIIGLILKSLLGRRTLLLISQSGMAVSMIMLGIRVTFPVNLTQLYELY